MITEEQIEGQFNNLPEELKEIISSIDFATIIPTLGEKYSLTIDKQGILHGQISLLMLGAISVGDFESELQSELGLSPEQAEKLLLDVDEFVLTPGRMAYLGMGEEGEEVNQEREKGEVNLSHLQGCKLASKQIQEVYLHLNLKPQS